MELTSKERLLAAINGDTVDHLPLYCWVFGFSPPKKYRWERDGRDVQYWYTMRLEHIHTLPQAWDIHDDFNRVKTWFKLGLDDVLDVSVPWGISPDVKIKDWREGNLLCRVYDTPEGPIVQKVRLTEEEIPLGWVIQAGTLRLFEDLNLPRAQKFPLCERRDLPGLKYLLNKPVKEQIENYKERISLIKDFAKENGILVQGWSAFGMDGIIWLMGVDNAVVTAMTEPDFFQEIVNTMFQFDLMRTQLMLDIGGIDMVVQRGWYSSTDFWSPTLFRKFILPCLKRLVEIVHQNGLKFAYTVTTGVEAILEELVEAGIDLLYFVDPEQDRVNLVQFKERLNGRFSVAGGINSSITLKQSNPDGIRKAAISAVESLGKKRFILSSVDALFPDTPWENVEAMISAWREVR